MIITDFPKQWPIQISNDILPNLNYELQKTAISLMQNVFHIIIISPQDDWTVKRNAKFFRANDSQLNNWSTHDKLTIDVS